jgi:4-amino-4-deoxy-L-arabinose transferase-like glycosyltransferase
VTRAAWPRTTGPGFAVAAWILFAGYCLWGAPGVPFHPDESTYLYMSRDFDLLFRQGDPAAVTWRAANQPQDVIRYRLLDGALAHYLPGLGRLLGGYTTALPRDWDWSASWAGNAALGALPDAGLLNAARWPAAALTALSLLPLYGIGARLGGMGTGLIAVLLYAFSGLALLHGRRAMAEAPLLFFSLAAVWLVLRWPRQPILAGALTALAVASKLTALSLLPVAGIALLWRQTSAASGQSGWRSRWDWRAGLRSLLLYVTTFVGIGWLLTPPLWSQPMAGLAAMVSARGQLIAGQAGALGAAAPGQVLGSVGERLFAMLYHVFFAPPAFWDIPNYAAQTRAAELAYLAAPFQAGWHTTSLGNNLVAGGVILALTLAGVGFGVHELAAPRPTVPIQRNTFLILLAWSATTLAGLLPINIAWQRYYLPLLPIVCLWAAYGLASVFRPFAKAGAT